MYENWDMFDDPDGKLEGMERFTADGSIALDVVRYIGEANWSWMIRIWGDDSRKCRIIASYDRDEYFYSIGEAYADMVNVLKRDYSHLVPDDPIATEMGLRRDRMSFIQKALSLGFAAMISLGMLGGSSLPTVYAYADDGGGAAAQVVYEVVDGEIDGYAVAQTVAEYESLGQLDPSVDLAAFHAIADQGDSPYESGAGVLIFEQGENGAFSYDHALAVLDSGTQIRLYGDALVDFMRQEMGEDYRGIPIDYLKFDASPAQIARIKEADMAHFNEVMDRYEDAKAKEDIWGTLSILSVLALGVSVQLFYRAHGITGKKNRAD